MKGSSARQLRGACESPPWRCRVVTLELSRACVSESRAGWQPHTQWKGEEDPGGCVRWGLETSFLLPPTYFHRLFSGEERGSEQKSLRGVLPYSASPLRSLPCSSAPRVLSVRTLVHPALTPTPLPLHPKSRPTSQEPETQEPEPERTHLLPLG